MDYIRTDADGQLALTQSTGFLKIPSCLYGFVNESTSTGMTASGRTVIRFSGSLQADNEDVTCSCCSKKTEPPSISASTSERGKVANE